MQGFIITIIAILLLSNANAGFDINLILNRNEVSLGSFRSSTSIGNVTKTYPKLQPEDLTASRNAIMVIKLLRRMFGVGILSIPPLDPFSRTNLKPLTIRNNVFISGKIKLNSLKIIGAKNFQLKTFQLQMRAGRVDFNITFPNLNVNVSFHTDLYFGGLIPVAVKEQLRATVKEFQCVGALQIEESLHKGLSPDLVYQISGAAVHGQIKDVEVALAKGLNLKDTLLQVINVGKEYVSLSQWLASTRNPLSNYLLNMFTSTLNNVLRSVSVEQVNAFLLADDD